MTDLKVWLSLNNCPNCLTSFTHYSFNDLIRTGGPRFRLPPPRPECWKFTCPACNNCVHICTRLDRIWLIGTRASPMTLDPISVNDAIDRLAELAGQTVSIYGILSLRFEGTSINHIPNTETRDFHKGIYHSSIWINFELGTIKQRKQWREQFDGHQVQILGRLIGPQNGYQGCGHSSMWPADITLTAIKRYSRKQNMNN